MFNRITILGVGLLGASFAMAVKKSGLCNSVTGYGRNRENLLKAKERNFIDSFETDPAEACKDADLIMLSTPAGSFLDLIKAISPALKKGAILTDVGSVKGKLVREIEKTIPKDVHYIGGHPIAGSDRSGIASANAELFRNAKCIITPTENSDPEALEKIQGLWKALGSGVIAMNPEEHDRIYAAVSHLPHLIAYAMVNTVADMDSSYLDFSGKGFMDATRIASSSEELWNDICLLNRDNLAEVIAVFQKNMDMLNQYLKAGDSDSLKNAFRKARRLREHIG
ncbi:MAG: prephenate dehydrogenase/arogenate dehydrogenase family protein [Nitrospira bacterium HGW-Nitrospira-1]|nr:MAG: prephenate dehydrogenase/arogenate dehydrogenase family protein [Nitrospira bacterium HGW-Nitrospira-1]